MKKKAIIIEVLVMALLGAGLAVCGNIESGNNETKCDEEQAPAEQSAVQAEPEEVIIDCNYTFEEALEGSNAPQNLRDNLSLYEVRYISTDGKLHQGQILSNKEIEQDVKEMFEIMLRENFVIEKAIPIVKYGWDDNKSMEDNNTYCFCYRDMSYSFHANGMAIDINPYFNPQRWKGEWRKARRDKPAGAVYDTTRNGTFKEGSLIVNEWKARGFHWGHYMERKADDHHFQKAALGAKPSYNFKSESAAADNDINTATDYDTVKPSKPVKKANTAEKAQKKPAYNYKGLTDEEIAEKERLREAKERILERTRRHRKSADSILGKAWSRK